MKLDKSRTDCDEKYRGHVIRHGHLCDWFAGPDLGEHGIAWLRCFRSRGDAITWIDARCNRPADGGGAL